MRTPNASSASADKERRYLFARDVFHGCLTFLALCIWWVLGSTWYFWPLWIALGMAMAFLLRAATDCIWMWGNCAQTYLERLTGSWGQKRVQILDKSIQSFFDGKWWPKRSSHTTRSQERKTSSTPAPPAKVQNKRTSRSASRKKVPTIRVKRPSE